MTATATSYNDDDDDNDGEEKEEEANIRCERKHQREMYTCNEKTTKGGTQNNKITSGQQICCVNYL